MGMHKSRAEWRGRKERLEVAAWMAWAEGGLHTRRRAGAVRDAAVRCARVGTARAGPWRSAGRAGLLRRDGRRGRRAWVRRREPRRRRPRQARRLVGRAPRSGLHTRVRRCARCAGGRSAYFFHH
jgi:hypothetical protein